VRAGFLIMPKNLGDIDKLKIALDSLTQFMKSIADMSYFTGIPIRSFDEMRSAYATGQKLLENLKKTESDISEKKKKNHS